MSSKINKNIFVRSNASAAAPARMEKNSDSPKLALVTNPDSSSLSTVVLQQVQALIKAIKAGKLETRADLSAASGNDRELLNGINEMLDAVINPLGVAAHYVDRIAKGDIPEKITDEYHGDFNTIKDNL
ncbi:MAG: hypothetical protein GX295_05370, partial [Syntrophomonadaceae bacterium]|nr:hypothetical protein [Syntrophomonadaceae bacterium]